MATRRAISARLAALALALLLVHPGPAQAGAPVGREPFVIADQPVDTGYPSAAYNSLWQEYMVVWRNERPVDDDLYGQILSRDGERLGNWFAVSAGPGAERRYPDIAYNPTRNEYLVVWERLEPVWGVRTVVGQRFRGDSGQLGGEFIINATTDSRPHQQPKVAFALASGRYLVVWDTYEWGGATGDILGQFVNGDGTLSGAPLTIAQGTSTTDHWAPDLAYNLARNEFLVAFIRDDTNVGARDIRGRRVTGDGVLLHPPLVTIENLSQSCTKPAVAAIPRPAGDGRYLVTWYSTMPGTGPDIYASLFDGDGNPVRMDLPVRNDPGESYEPAAAGNEGSEQFLVSYIINSPGTDFLPAASEIDLDGGPFLADPVPVLGWADTNKVSVTSGPQGDLLVVFDAKEASGNYDIHGRLWGNRLYLPVVIRRS